jgi:hypothetical protein
MYSPKGLHPKVYFPLRAVVISLIVVFALSGLAIMIWGNNTLGLAVWAGAPMAWLADAVIEKKGYRRD